MIYYSNKVLQAQQGTVIHSEISPVVKQPMGQRIMDAAANPFTAGVELYQKGRVDPYLGKRIETGGFKSAFDIVSDVLSPISWISNAGMVMSKYGKSDFRDKPLVASEQKPVSEQSISEHPSTDKK